MQIILYYYTYITCFELSKSDIEKSSLWSLFA